MNLRESAEFVIKTFKYTSTTKCGPEALGKVIGKDKFLKFLELRKIKHPNGFVERFHPSANIIFIQVRDTGKWVIVFGAWFFDGCKKFPSIYKRNRLFGKGNLRAWTLQIRTKGTSPVPPDVCHKLHNAISEMLATYNMMSYGI